LTRSRRASNGTFFDDSDDSDVDDSDFDDSEDEGPLSTPKGKGPPSKASKPKSPGKPAKSLPTGSIKCFKLEGGFGFIACDDGRPDLFFHMTEVTNLAKGTNAALVPGAKVEWASEGSNTKGRFAKQVRVLEGAMQTSQPLDHAKVLKEAADYAYRAFYKKPYTKGNEYDKRPIFGVHRSNHGIASSVRKAVLVPPVAKLFELNDPELLLAMQLAMIFEVTGRNSEIGIHDFDGSEKIYLKMKAASLDNFAEYYQSKFDQHASFANKCKLALSGLRNMYCCTAHGVVERITSVFELCHDHDLFRCKDEEDMEEKLGEFDELEPEEQALVLLAEEMIFKTGDRLMCSLSRDFHPRDYDEALWPKFGNSPQACLQECLKIVSKAQPKSQPKAQPKAQAKPSSGGRSLSSSKFKLAYSLAEVKKVTQKGFFAHAAVFELFEKVIAPKFGVPVAEALAYCEKIHEHAVKAGGTDEYLNQSNLYAARLWTTQEVLRGREFCSYLNELLRRDDLPSDQMTILAKVCRVINAAIADKARTGQHAKWPKSNRLYRGGKLPASHRSFFKVGTEFRAPMYLATSDDLQVAQGFLRDNSDPENGVLWVIELNDCYKCKHVNYLDGVSTCKGESEFLFPPYSPFTVKAVEPPTSSSPMKIVLEAAVDGKTASESLPLSPWN